MDGTVVNATVHLMQLNIREKKRTEAKISYAKLSLRDRPHSPPVKDVISFSRELAWKKAITACSGCPFASRNWPLRRNPGAYLESCPMA